MPTYINKPFLEKFYQELKKLSNFLTIFAIFNKKFPKIDC